MVLRKIAFSSLERSGGMILSFSEGKFISQRGQLNYQEVLDDFPTAHTIRILTYNISKSKKYDELLEKLKNNTTADIQLITNIPSRMEKYYDSSAGKNKRSSARRNIQIYVSKLNPKQFSEKFSPFFNFNNHAKIIGTENVVYIGSANYSNESTDNIETGVIIYDKIFIQDLYSQFFNSVKQESTSYLDDDFNEFRLFIISLYFKFEHHHTKILTDLFTGYGQEGYTLSYTIFMDTTDLDNLYRDLEEVESIYSSIDDFYDKSNTTYNAEIQIIKDKFENIDIKSLMKTIEEGGTLYRLVAYDGDQTASDILQEEIDAVDEALEMYAEDAADQAAQFYDFLRNDFLEESDSFLEEIEKIISALDSANLFVEKWKNTKINPVIDNT